MAEWNFAETIRGTVKGIPVNLDLAGLEIGEDEWEVDAHEEEEEEEVPWASVRVRVEPGDEEEIMGSRNVSSYSISIEEE